MEPSFSSLHSASRSKKDIGVRGGLRTGLKYHPAQCLRVACHRLFPHEA